MEQIESISHIVAHYVIWLIASPFSEHGNVGKIDTNIIGVAASECGTSRQETAR